MWERIVPVSAALGPTAHGNLQILHQPPPVDQAVCRRLESSTHAPRAGDLAWVRRWRYNPQLLDLSCRTVPIRQGCVEKQVGKSEVAPGNRLCDASMAGSRRCVFLT